MESLSLQQQRIVSQGSVSQRCFLPVQLTHGSRATETLQMIEALLKSADRSVTLEAPARSSTGHTYVLHYQCKK